MKGLCLKEEERISIIMGRMAGIELGVVEGSVKVLSCCLEAGVCILEAGVLVT
jgi:hypothetical protein